MADVSYEVNGCLEYVEEDSFEHGCDPKTGYDIWLDLRWSAPTLAALLEELKGFVGEEEADLDCCDEVGRVDICRMECEDGTQASPREIEQFNAGELRLWYACYSFKVERVTRETVSLQEIQAVAS